MIQHIPREENEKANALAQQASGYNVVKRYFNIKKLMQIKAESLVMNELVRTVAEIGLTGQTGLAAEGGGSSNSANNSDQKVGAEVQDWRIPIITYLKDPGRGADRNIRCLAFKYILVDDELYRRITDDILLKCFGTN